MRVLAVLMGESATSFELGDALPKCLACGLLDDGATDQHYGVTADEFAENVQGRVISLLDEFPLLFAQDIQLRIGRILSLELLDLLEVLGQPTHHAIAQVFDLLQPLVGDEHSLAGPLHPLNDEIGLAAK